MADMTQMAADLIHSRGLQPTPENMQQVIQFFASNPDQLERNAMGLRNSGIDDNSGALMLQLDKLIAASDRPVSTSAPVAEPTSTSAPVRRAAPTSATTPPVQTEGLTYNPNQNLGPLPPQNVPVKDGSGGDWILPMLTALLGLSSTRGRAGESMPRPGGVADAVTPAPRGVGAAAQAALTDSSNSKPPIVPIPEVGDGTAKERLAAPPAQLASPESAAASPPPQAQIGNARAGQKNLPPYDNKQRTQDEFDAANKEMDNYESQTKKERAAQIRKEKAARALRNVKK